jgi:serine/threonine-protein phosphatase PGAM5
LKRSRTALLVVAMVMALCASRAAADAASLGSGTHYLYLVRHGIYEPDRNAGDPADSGLNALGHEQARLVGARLAALPIRPAALVSSPLRRARETAEDIGGALGMTPTLDSLLRECTPTADRADYMKNHAAGEIAACDSSLALAWARYVVPTPGADRHEILVCHANVIRWFVSRVVGGTPAHWPAMEIANGSVTTIAVQADGTARLVMFSDVGHLPLQKQTWTGRGAGWSATPAHR